MGSLNFHFLVSWHVTCIAPRIEKDAMILKTLDILTRMPAYQLTAAFASSQVYLACDSPPTWVVPLISTTTVRITNDDIFG